MSEGNPPPPLLALTATEIAVPGGRAGVAFAGSSASRKNVCWRLERLFHLCHRRISEDPDVIKIQKLLQQQLV